MESVRRSVYPGGMLAALVCALALLEPGVLSSSKHALAQGGATEIEVTVPDAFVQSGTLPVYELIKRDFADVVQPEWFDGSGVVKKENLSKRGRYDHYTFADEDELSVSGEKDGYIYYAAKEGMAQTVYDDGSITRYPANERTVQAENLAMDVFWGYMDDPTGGAPVCEELAFVTLDGAYACVEDMLDKLGVTGYECIWVLGLDAEAIRTLNAQRNTRIETGRLYTSEIYDFGALTERDEGYALVYRARVDGVETWGSFMDLRAFVSGDGLRSFSLSAPYALGDIIMRPDGLITPQEAVALLPASVRKSRVPSLEQQMGAVTRAELIYSFDPQARGSELRLLPAWRLHLLFADHEEEGIAYVSAVDGTVLDAPWK